MQIILAVFLMLIGVVLFFAKNKIGQGDMSRASEVSSVIAMLTGLLVLAFYTASPEPSGQSLSPTPPEGPIPTGLSTNIPAPTIPPSPQSDPTTLPVTSPSSPATQNCFHSDRWTPFERDAVVLQEDGCWDLSAWGFAAEENDILLAPAVSTQAVFHGIYTPPIENSSEIRFDIRVDRFEMDPSVTGSIEIGVISLNPPGPATSRLVRFDYTPEISTAYLSTKAVIDRGHETDLPVSLLVSMPLEVTLRVEGALLRVIVDGKQVTIMTMPFEKRAFWIGYSIPAHSELNLSIEGLAIK